MQDTITPEEQAKWTRRFDVECNNRAWRLAESVARSEAANEEMLHCAHAAALHWSQVGTELHNARATMLLGHVHALIGDGPRAMAYARQAFDFVLVTIAPAADLAGNTFQVIALLREGRWAIVRFVLDILRGRHVDSPRVTVREASSLVVRCRIPSAAQVDGDYLCPLPVRFAVTGVPLRIVVPNDYPFSAIGNDRK